MSAIPNTNYAIGRRAEYKAKADLEKIGYFCLRSSGSHSPCDILALKGNEVRFIQVKSTKAQKITNANIPERYLKELDNLRSIVHYLGQPNYTAELWVKSKARGWAIRKYRYGNGY